MDVLLCDNCGMEPGRFHVSFTVNVEGPHNQRIKQGSFWLCEVCERYSRKVLAHDEGQAQRLSRALVNYPEVIGGEI